MASGEVRSSVIVLTVWTESSDPHDLRARVAAVVAEELREDRESFAASGVDDVCARLRAWLESFARGDSRCPLEAESGAMP
jgi:hypothetical protein